MKIHEYQAKELLRKFEMPVPKGEMTDSKERAYDIAKGLNFPVVIKAQIHAGGRGKGGGIKLAGNLDEVSKHAGEILGMCLKTPQTGRDGKRVKKILIEEAIKIEKEFYLGLVVDRVRSEVALIASPEGGVEIEEVASKHPERIFKTWIQPEIGLQPYQTRKIGFELGLGAREIQNFSRFALNLSRLYHSADASLAEINPLVLTKERNFIALDAKINLDDNALFRHPDLAKLLDPDEEDRNELEAKEEGLNYISLEGNIGCLVNGAGLAMATMDIIKLSGGEPCNFLDVGGGATEEGVTKAFKIILRNPKVKAIFVNIFGGILKCDLLARGIVAAGKELGIKVPLVIRLLGTRVEEGKQILNNSGLNIVSEEDFALAARKVVAAAKN